MNMYLIYIALFILLILIFIISRNTAKRRTEKEIKKAGNDGEKYFKQIAKDILKPTDTLINNVELNIDGKEAEIDNIIINQNGIFIVEVKNYNGVLYGDIDDFEWTKIKSHPNGKTFSKQVVNPIRQVKRQTYVLSRALKKNNIHIWINGYVYFVNNNSPIDSAYVIKNINSFGKMIHTNQGKTYDKDTIKKAIKTIKNGGN